ncbi:MAG: HD domain-containing protein [Clostridia bacterium]|nr:HD domain-containing protein [Clostridia bacterium]
MEVFFENIIKLTDLINSGANVDNALDYVFKSFTDYIPYERIGIALLDNGGSIYAQSARVKNEARLKNGFSIALHSTSLKEIIEKKRPRIINSYHEYLKNHPDSEPTKLMIEEGIVSSIACPLIASNTCIGVMFFSSTYTKTYSERHTIFAKMLASHMSIVIEKNLLVDDLILASVSGFAKLVEAKDNDTGKHVERIQHYSKTIARTLSSNYKYRNIIDEQYVKDIFNFSALHDIGKVGIPDVILLKPGKLDVEEFTVMKTHTTIGGDVLKKASNNLLRDGRRFFDMGIDIAVGHHEKYNGAGYPYGISGEGIPLSARIVAVADVLDAISSKRVYKEATEFDTALGMVASDSGKSFDPDVVNALIESKTQIAEIYQKFKEV